MNMINYFRAEHYFLSNFWPCQAPYMITLDGETYRSVEHAYQAAKTLDPKGRRMVQYCPTGADAKRYGKTIMLRPSWDEEKPVFMLNFLRQKFRDPNLRVQLQMTGDAKLVEGNDRGDVYWGVCRGQGLNMLGLLLMRVRAEL